MFAARRALGQASISSVADISVEDVLKKYFTHNAAWVDSLVSRIDNGLSPSRQLSNGEIFGFFGYFATCCFYDKSPTLVSSDAHCDKFRKPQMSYERFIEIIRALKPICETNSARSSNWDDYGDMAPEFKVAVEQLSQLAQSLGFSKDNTNISGDDDKCHLRGSSVIKEVGLSKTFQRGSKSGPVAI